MAEPVEPAPPEDVGSESSLDFLHCSYVVMNKKKGEAKQPRYLIDDVSAKIPAGVVLAVMGPSGAGKTTLLSMIMLDKMGGKPEGIVTLNGNPLDLKTYTAHCSVVTQHDCLWWSMTPREHVSAALSFYQPHLSLKDRHEAVDKLIADMGLTSCQHTKAGNQFVKGLSGGQKRRLSLAVALCKQPLVIFLDEPTSGLDAAAAASIMSFLKQSAAKSKISIFCTIHSPSAAVFNGFDQVLFLSGGKPAYLGQAAELPAYLEEIKEPLPPNTNPADHILDLINKDFNDPAQVDKLLDRWRRHHPHLERTPQQPLVKKRTAGLLRQTRLLLGKHFKLIFTDPILYIGRLIAYPLMSFFFLIIYIETRNLRQDQVQPRVYLGMWSLCVPSMMAIIAVFALNQELIPVRREIKDGMYSVGAYCFATTVIQIPMVFLLGLVTMLPAIYPTANWEWDYFYVAWLLTGSTLLGYEYVAQLLSLIQNPLIGMLLFMNCWFVLFLFNGVLMRTDDVIWPFRCFIYMSPMRYGVANVVWAALIATPPYDGAVLCNPENDPQCNPGGFKCPDDETGVTCFGVTGAQILDSLQARYDTVSSEEQWAEHIAWCLIFAVGIKIIYFVAFVWQTRQVALVKPPDMDASTKRSEAAAASAASAATEPVQPHAVKPPPLTSGGVVNSSFKRSVKADLIFKQCTFTVMVKSKEGKGPKVPRKLIDDMSAKVEAGSVLAIMGPSGAGKTTLLNMLMLERTGGDPRGIVTLNGHDFTLDLYTKHACVVQQHDLLWWPLSPRDHITYAVQLYQSAMSKDEKAELVENLIKNTGLSSCQNTRAGNVFAKGLSGGQKRRLSLAVALAKKPHVVFLDEPTSGLDAAAAASITQYLKDVAKAESLAIMCTIHQPSTAVFNGFDKVLFLTGGRPAFLGKASDLVGFLDKIGKPAPLTANPADFMLDLINKDFGDIETMEAVVEAWAKEKEEIPIPETKALAEKKKTPILTVVGVLFKKHFRLLYKDPIAYFVRIVMFLMSMAFFIVTYVKTRDLEQPQIINRVWLSMWAVGVPSSLGVVVVYLVNNDYQIVKREVKDGMYKPLTYTLAQLCLQLPMIAILSLAALVPFLYPIAKWEWSQFWRAYVTYYLMLAAFEFLAELLAIVISNPLIGMLVFVNCWFSAFIFCGILVDPQAVPWPFRLFTYILPLRWSVNELVWAIFVDTPNYEGTARCDPTDSIAIDGPNQGEIVNCPRGFYCPDDPAGTACWGETGSEILESLHVSFPAISTSDNFAQDLGINIAIAVCFKFFYLVAFLLKSRSGKPPKKP